MLKNYSEKDKIDIVLFTEMALLDIFSIQRKILNHIQVIVIKEKLLNFVQIFLKN